MHNNGEAGFAVFLHLQRWDSYPAWMVTLDGWLPLDYFNSTLVRETRCVWQKTLGGDREPFIPWFHWLSRDRFRYWIARTAFESVRYTGSQRMVLTLFYCRKSNWNARLRACLFSHAVPHRGTILYAKGFISRFHRSILPPPRPLGSWLSPYPTYSEYKSRRSLSQVCPWIVWISRSLPLMKKPVETLHRLYLRPPPVISS